MLGVINEEQNIEKKNEIKLYTIRLKEHKNHISSRCDCLIFLFLFIVHLLINKKSIYLITIWPCTRHIDQESLHMDYHFGKHRALNFLFECIIKWEL